jgi:hypothetical protein
MDGFGGGRAFVETSRVDAAAFDGLRCLTLEAITLVVWC